MWGTNQVMLEIKQTNTVLSINYFIILDLILCFCVNFFRNKNFHKFINVEFLGGFGCYTKKSIEYVLLPGIQYIGR